MLYIRSPAKTTSNMDIDTLMLGIWIGVMLMAITDYLYENYEIKRR